MYAPQSCLSEMPTETRRPSNVLKYVLSTPAPRFNQSINWELAVILKFIHISGGFDTPPKGIYM